MELEFVENYYGYDIFYSDGYFIVENELFDSFRQAVDYAYKLSCNKE